MSELPTLAEFEACVGDVFRATAKDQQTVELQLIEAAVLTSSRPDRPGASFSLLFRGPANHPLPQQMFPLHHERLGEHLIFLVPISPDAHGPLYEAVFS